MESANPMEQAPSNMAPEESLDLTPEESAFMKRADITSAELAKFKRWEKLAKEMGVDLAA